MAKPKAPVIKRTFIGPHPTKRSRYFKTPDGDPEPVRCCAETTVAIGKDRIAISMNGTAVMSLDEFNSWTRDIWRETISA